MFPVYIIIYKGHPKNSALFSQNKCIFKKGDVGVRTASIILSVLFQKGVG